MHELPVTESILEIALRYADQAKAKKITDLYLVIGQLSSLVDDSIQFYWDIIAKDTIAEGARLHFQRIPAEMLCQDCGTSFAPDAETLPCPNCGSVRLKVVRGEEFRLDSIDVEEEDLPGILEKKNAAKHTGR